MSTRRWSSFYSSREAGIRRISCQLIKLLQLWHDKHLLALSSFRELTILYASSSKSGTLAVARLPFRLFGSTWLNGYGYMQTLAGVFFDAVHVSLTSNRPIGILPMVEIVAWLSFRMRDV
jgi:lysophospholipid acyltransferase (LPLAT)-like uncharacterized protein